MKIADSAALAQLDARAEARKQAILDAPDELTFSGRVFYVSQNGDDGAAGDAGHPWRTLARVSRADLAEGDAVLFRRGDLFRGQLLCQSGVTYGAWGTGPKPRLYGGDRNLAHPALWILVDEAHHIYRLAVKIIDLGTLVFDDGARWGYKHIPSFLHGQFVCREDPARPFVLSRQLTRDLDFFCDCRAAMTEAPSHGETWPVPETRGLNPGDLYLRCDAGNPGAVFRSIEPLPGRHLVLVGGCHNVRLDNLCLKYAGAHAVSAGGPCVRGLSVTSCEIGWIGGCVQHYLGTDPNYPQGTRGSVTRYGNGIEIYGGCEGYLCENNYIYQVYDAGVTHQFTVAGPEGCVMKDVRYRGNLIERCVYSIEYFLSETEGTDSLMDGVVIEDNMLRFAGFGWGQQRHNTQTPAHIKSWSFENPARGFVIRGNVFDRSRYRLLHLVCREPADYPIVDGNVYVQAFGRALGQFGPMKDGLPPTLSFFEEAERDVREQAGDTHAEVIALKNDEPAYEAHN